MSRHMSNDPAQVIQHFYFSVTSFLKWENNTTHSKSLNCYQNGCKKTTVLATHSRLTMKQKLEERFREEIFLKPNKLRILQQTTWKGTKIITSHQSYMCIRLALCAHLKIRTNLELNENKNSMHQKLGSKPLLRGHFIALTSSIRNKEVHKIN